MGDSILWISGRLDGCWWYRVELPRRWLSARGYDVRVVDGEGGQDVGHIADFGAMVLQRVGYAAPNETATMLAFMRELRARGARVYYEIDDDLWHNNFLKSGGPMFLPRPVRRAVMRDTERLIERCSGVIVTTPELGERLRRHHPHVTVIPNAVPEDLCGPGSRPHTGVRIGWSGSMSHGLEGDFDRALPALRRVLEARPDVQLVFMGWHPPEVEAWPRTEWTGWGPIEDYYARLEALDLDIFVAPLSDSTFNRGKSPSKLLEAGALGWALVVEPHGPYRNVLQDECTCLYAATTAEWETALRRLVDESETRRRLGGAVRAYVRRNHTMEQTGPLWEQTLLGRHAVVSA